MRGLVVIFSIFSLLSCGGGYSSQRDLHQRVDLYPDYDSVVVPHTIAPLNFMVSESADSFIFDFYSNLDDEPIFSLKSSDNSCDIPLKKWHEMLSDSSLSELKIVVSAIREGVKCSYTPITIFVSQDPIDSYIVYRLIEPGYEFWGQMGIYERDITSFEVSPIVENNPKEKGCVNCHSFCSNSTDKFMFHARRSGAGTYISIDGEVESIDTKVGSMLADATYPSWHPEGRYIAFSTNITRQGFHNSGDKVVEVFDLDSDIVVYDTQTSTMFSSPLLYNKDEAESFPYWSRDGKHLYFVSTKKQQEESINQFELKYNLYRVAFDAKEHKFSDYELIFDARSVGKSVTTPRPFHSDSRVSFAMCDYGSFAIWHAESDLYALDLEIEELERLDVLNSDESDSYRSFSSGDNWVVYTSRRDDGLYTRLYISHYDQQTGRFSKPFMLPQREATDNFYNEKSYNVPEFITKRVDNQRQIKSAFKKKPKKIKNNI